MININKRVMKTLLDVWTSAAFEEFVYVGREKNVRAASKLLAGAYG